MNRILLMIKTLGFLFLIAALCVCGSAPAAEVDKEEDNPRDETSWLPRIAFPPSDPEKGGGWLPFIDRAFSFRWGAANLSLSMARALELSLEGTEFYLRMGFRAYLDCAKYYEDKNDLGGDILGLRLFMVEIDGRITKKWHYRLSWGGFTQGGRFDGSGAFLDDAYVNYMGDTTSWIFGQHSEPFSLEDRTSGLSMTFMERALPNALVTGTNVGISFSASKERWNVSVGTFFEDLASQRDLSNQGLGLTGRFVFRPGRSGGILYHLGGSLSWRSSVGGPSTFFRSRPESGLTDVRYVDTGEITGMDNIFRFGAEGAIAAGPISLQSEYISAFVQRLEGLQDVAFQGWYAYVSWFPTGETRKYFPSSGIFGYPDIKSKYGAVELAVRYSMLDLNDGPIRGGKEQNITFGANWYISSKIRLMANYILVNNDKNADADETLRGNDDPQIFQMRLQFRF